MENFNVESWFAMFAPANTPNEIIKRVNYEIREALKIPAISEKLITTVGAPSFEDEVQAKQFVASEIRKYARILKDLDIKQ